MMGIFKITASGYSFEDWISIVVVAENEDKALEIAKQGNPYNWENPDKHDIYWKFDEEQYPLLVEKINLKKEKVIISEYYGD